LSSLTQHPLADSWVFAEHHPLHLNVLEESVAALLSAGFDETQLHEALAAALGKDARKWSVGNGELLGLAYLARHNALVRPGWPAGHSGASPFDAEIRAPGASPASLVVDIKPAAQCGFAALHASINDDVHKWSLASRAGPIHVRLRCHGVLSQGLVRTHGASLSKQVAAAGAAALRLPTSFQVQMGSDAKADVEVLAGPPALNATGGLTRGQKAALAQSTIDGHIASKAKHHALGCPPFLLMYVAPYGHPGADIDADVLENVVSSLDGEHAPGTPSGDLWLGCLYLDQRRPDEVLSMFLRDRTLATHGLKATQLATLLGGDVVHLAD
jgi:hypothetical protein